MAALIEAKHGGTTFSCLEQFNPPRRRPVASDGWVDDIVARLAALIEKFAKDTK